MYGCGALGRAGDIHAVAIRRRDAASVVRGVVQAVVHRTGPIDGRGQQPPFFQAVDRHTPLATAASFLCLCAPRAAP
jgi:hypothetical protein